MSLFPWQTWHPLRAHQLVTVVMATQETQALSTHSEKLLVRRCPLLFAVFFAEKTTTAAAAAQQL